MTEIACMSQKISTLGLFDMQRGDLIASMINQVNLKYIFCCSSNLSRLLSLKEEGLIPTLELIIQYEEVSLEEKKHANAVNLSVFSLREIESFPKLSPKNIVIDPDDTFTLCCTSGTTGDPKAAMISHKNLLSAIINARHATNLGLASFAHTHISYISLAHLMERFMSYMVIFHGGKIGFPSGDATELAADMNILKPTILLSVPRMLTRVHHLIKQEFKKLKKMKGFLVKTALKTKLENHDKTGSVKHTL